MLPHDDRNKIRELRYTNRDIERIDSGISLMLDAFSLVEFGILETLHGRKPVCGAGCSYCCCQPIPVTPLEILTISAYLHVNKLVVQNRSHIKSCIFLKNNKCIVYPVRPIACRQYLIFNKKCTPSEDPTSTRTHDVFIPNYTYMHRALHMTLPWYAQSWQIPKDCNKESSWKFFKKISLLLQNVDW